MPRFGRVRLVVRFPALLVLVAALGGGAGLAAAGQFTADPLVQVSGSSPFATCSIDNVASQSGTVYHNSEVEPWVDVNPTNVNNVVGIWQQDRWSNGGARGLVASVSANGGGSWTTVVVPKITLCSGGTAANGGDYQRATDPWVSFGPDGHVHQLSLSFNDSNFVHALLASKSTNGGLTWSDPVVVIKDTAPTVFNDKQTITADPGNARLVYAVWDRLVFPNERANVKAAFHAAAFRGPTWFARSTTGGATWEPARQIFDPGQNDQTIGNQIVVLPNGQLVDVFNLIFNQNAKKQRGSNVALIRSSDKGVSWSGPIVVDRLGTVTVVDPETGDPVRTGDIIPDVAVDRNPGSPGFGNLYLVWQDARFTGQDAVALSVSTDGGSTWSTAIQVNRTPTNLPPGNQQAFTPSVHVASDGTVGVTYYDFRNNTEAAALQTDYFMVHCHPTTASTCAASVNWGAELRLTDASFDMRRAPFAVGFFTGDYEGLSNVGLDLLAFFSQPHGSDPGSIFSRRAGP
jgi:hypothetical protein